MLCITQAFTRSAKGQVCPNKAVLRRIVTGLLQANWGMMKSAFVVTNANVDKTRLRPGDISQRLPTMALAALATQAYTLREWAQYLVAVAPTPNGPAPLFPELADACQEAARHRGALAADRTLFGPFSTDLVLNLIPASLLRHGKDPVSAQGKASVLTMTGNSPVRQGPTAADITDGSAAVYVDNLEAGATFQELLASYAVGDARRRWIITIMHEHDIATSEEVDAVFNELDQEPEMQDTSAISISAKLNPTVSGLMNKMLESLELPKIEELADAFDRAAAAAAQVAAIQSQLEAAKSEAKSLEGKLALASTSTIVMPQPVAASGEWPAYKIGMKLAADVFDVPSSARSHFSVQVPVIEWEGAPPAEVPAVDEHYAFRPDSLMSTIYGLVTNTNVVATGHTGTGKTSLFEQVAARLRMPIEIINLDSEITRLDIMGRDVLDSANGASVTRFEEGIVPRAMQRPGFLVLDEFDFGRPDVMYALQRVLTGTGLTLTEDGGRYIAPHPFFRVVATGNTKGTGDETGLYQGARIQSAAFLNRFGVWIEVDYMKRAAIEELLQKRVPGLHKVVAAAVAHYTEQHQKAFSERTVLTPFSMRDAVHLAKSMALFEPLVGANKARDLALSQTVYNRTSASDAQVLKGIGDRVFA